MVTLMTSLRQSDGDTDDVTRVTVTLMTSLRQSDGDTDDVTEAE